MLNTMKAKKCLLLAAKIAIGSSAAIYVAERMSLEYSSSAGIVTLLTLLTTRKGTVKLSIARLVTFAIIPVVTFFTFIPIKSTWIAYGLYIFLIASICGMLNWQATISTNAVIGTHFLMSSNFSPEFFLNEFLLVAIGIFFAFILNLFHDFRGQKEDFSKQILWVENQMQEILEDVAKYLSQEPTHKEVWKEVSGIQRKLREFLMDAREYAGNAFEGDAAYYAKFFEMRLDQCRILSNLHSEMRKIKEVPTQARIVAEYVRYMNRYVTELNEPTLQLQALEDIFQRMKEEPLPVTRKEFENRAVLYHILMDLEEFLMVKQQFIADTATYKVRIASA